jgi:iron complex transport system substrate-binding protein
MERIADPARRGIPFQKFAGLCLIVLGLGASLAFGLASCRKTEAGPAAASALYWKTLKRPGGEMLLDGEGNEIPLKGYRRIVTLSPGAVETFYLCGGEGAIAAIAASSLDPVWPPEKTALLRSVGSPARPSLEEVIALEPDLVIGSVMNIAFVADLKARGIPAIVHSAESLEDIFYSSLMLGVLCGREEEAAALVAEKRQSLERLAAERRGKPLPLKGAFLYSVNPVMAFAPDSLAGDILAVLGVENIAAAPGAAPGAGSAAQPILSPEYLLAANPDFLFGAIFIPKAEDILLANQTISLTRAGREGNISIIPSSLLLRPSPRIVDSLPELSEKITGYLE